MKEFKKKIDKLIRLINSEKNTETLFFGKVISLTYLTTAIEPIFQNSKNKTPSKNLLNIVDKTKNIFNSFVYLSNFTNKKSFIKSFENLNFF